MDYYGGGDLSKFIKSRSVLAEDVAKKFLQQLAFYFAGKTGLSLVCHWTYASQYLKTFFLTRGITKRAILIYE